LIIIEKSFDIIWGIIVAGIIGRIFLITEAKIARHLDKDSKSD
jgi:hypothetical protein